MDSTEVVQCWPSSFLSYKRCHSVYRYQVSWQTPGRHYRQKQWSGKEFNEHQQKQYCLWRALLWQHKHCFKAATLKIVQMRLKMVKLEMSAVLAKPRALFHKIHVSFPGETSKLFEKNFIFRSQENKNILTVVS